jgi:hypothetical protein
MVIHRFSRVIVLFLLCGLLYSPRACAKGVTSAGAAISSAAYIGKAVLSVIGCPGDKILDGVAKVGDYSSGVRSGLSLAVNLNADVFEFLRNVLEHKRTRSSSKFIDETKLAIILGNLFFSLLLSNDVGGKSYRPLLRVAQAILSYLEEIYPNRKRVHPSRVFASIFDIGMAAIKLDKGRIGYIGKRTPKKSDICYMCRLPFGNSNVCKMLSCNHWLCEGCVQRNGKKFLCDDVYDGGDWTNRNVQKTCMACPICCNLKEGGYQGSSNDQLKTCLFMGKTLTTLPADSCKTCHLCCENFGNTRKCVKNKCGCKGADKLVCNICYGKISKCPFCRTEL